LSCRPESKRHVRATATAAVVPWWYDGGAMVVPHNAFHQQSEQLPACPVHCQCAWWLWWPDALPWLRHMPKSIRHHSPSPAVPLCVCALSEWIRCAYASHATRQPFRLGLPSCKNAEKKANDAMQCTQMHFTLLIHRQSHRHWHVLVPINEQLQFKLDRSVSNLERCFYATHSIAVAATTS